MDKDLLLSYIKRVETLDEERAAILADKREVLKSAKNHGFESKYIRKIVALRKLDPDELDEEDEMTALYRKVANI